MDFILIVSTFACIAVYLTLVFSLFKYVSKQHPDKWVQMGGAALVENFKKNPFNRTLVEVFLQKFMLGSVPFLFSSDDLGDPEVARKKKITLIFLIISTVLFVTIFFLP
jgi:hypothetical protein